VSWDDLGWGVMIRDEEGTIRSEEVIREEEERRAHEGGVRVEMRSEVMRAEERWAHEGERRHDEGSGEEQRPHGGPQKDEPAAEA
jgi:hypothetical protein